ncbi:trk system potassium uptake protein TrkH [Neorhodopirellula lusitana]|uniref:Trk system potassium uptake protein TrkH n=1 Tax=Neorhodopirellula lusitana TaxID=445327 RepID=A0ABY1QTM7_9BACT|nr:trk system potassium uptake protein TrkH [Neorhodopirellula lusitana]
MKHVHPLKALLIGYLGYIGLGWILLCLPWSQGSGQVGALDHLFTATSAVSTTGLATVGTSSSYSFFGQIVILASIQMGGIGYMTLGSFILLARNGELPAARKNVARWAFVLPEGFSVVHFVRNVVLFTFSIEFLGALGLFIAFRSAGVENAFWQAIFHSVSAFCTAGFSLFPDSLEQFSANFWVLSVVAMLSVFGATGFLVMSDLFGSLFGKRDRVTLTTRIILHATGWMIVVGWIGLFLLEPSYRSLSNEDRVLASGFQAMSALTTVGFNSTPIPVFAHAPVFLLLLMMILGASPSGTGGGLKSTSVSAALATVWSTLKGRSKVTFWGCKVPAHRLTMAFSSVVFYIIIFFAGGLVLLCLQPEPMADILFEAASALGTVGLSRGITGDLTPLSKCVVIALMFIGRIGPITFGLALFSGESKPLDTEDLAV